MNRPHGPLQQTRMWTDQSPAPQLWPPSPCTTRHPAGCRELVKQADRGQEREAWERNPAEEGWWQMAQTARIWLPWGHSRPASTASQGLADRESQEARADSSLWSLPGLCNSVRLRPSNPNDQPAGQRALPGALRTTCVVFIIAHSKRFSRNLSNRPRE